MYKYQPQEIVDCFAKAKNINAAVKAFLKRDAKRGEPSERFAKEAKKVLVERPKEALNFVTSQLAQSEPFFYALAGHAHMTLVGSIAQEIVEKYADEFNDTYEIKNEQLKVTNKARFDAITKDVISKIETGLSSNGFENSSFMKNVLLLSIFNQEVIVEIVK